jgi:tRNA threonylcarbamoyladenosine biosynthesis protein TsaE
MSTFRTHSSEETTQLGRTFASSLRAGTIVALTGDLGTGKTHFIMGVCDGLGVRGHVASPTFTLVNEYPGDACTVVHVDLYRVSTRHDLESIGVEEYFTDRNICLLEWAERMAGRIPLPYIQITLEHGNVENDRIITIETIDAPVAMREQR